MPTKLTADEILQMAQRLEEKGARFYRKAARLHVAGRDLLNRIADQEDVHYAIFEKMRRSLAPGEKPAGADLFGDLEQYLDGMVDELSIQMNRNPEDALTGREPLPDILRTAIQMEKDSILFYVGLRQSPTLSGLRQRLDDIIREEMRHITWLTAQAKGS
ncbi:MAG: ferritin family protein [Verrucomicrobia bacterium]|nr:ferritin family protein [Verrucomicrobiota bacterium]